MVPEESAAPQTRNRKPVTEGSLLNRVVRGVQRLSPESRKAVKALLDVDMNRPI